jgi:hypothetical protein
MDSCLSIGYFISDQNILLIGLNNYLPFGAPKIKKQFQGTFYTIKRLIYIHILNSSVIFALADLTTY